MSRPPGRRPDPAWLAFVASLTVLLAVGFTAFGIRLGRDRPPLYALLNAVTDKMALAVRQPARYLSVAPVAELVQPARHPGSGVTRNEVGADDSLILLAGFIDGQSRLRLIRRDGTTVADWPASFNTHFPRSEFPELNAGRSDLAVDLHGAEIRPDGSVLFNYEYSGLVRLDRCGKLLWQLPHMTHHSVSPARGGGYWVPGRNLWRAGAEPVAYLPWPPPVRPAPVILDDLILRVSETGRITTAVSVSRVMAESGLGALLTAGRALAADREAKEFEVVHLNKIEELSAEMAPAFPQFEAGDLLLSLRDYNLLMVIDPDTWRVKWHQIGPWLRQHDPRFAADGTILLFNNNSYRLRLGRFDWPDPDASPKSNIMRLDPVTGQTTILYGDRPGEAFHSTIRGKQQPAPGGGILITEPEAGRVFQIGPERRLVWEYINRFDAELVGEINVAKAYPASYFTIDDWSCPGGTSTD